MRTWDDKEVKFLEANYGKMRQVEIARVLNRTPFSVGHRAYRLGIQRRRVWINVLPESSKRLTPELGYILGAVISDGSLQDRCIMIKVRDRDFAEHFKEVAERWSGFHATMYLNKQRYWMGFLSSKSATEFVRGFDFGKLLIADDSAKQAFLGGLFDGDGGVCVSRRRVGITSKDMDIIVLAQKLLLSLGITGKIRSFKGSGFNPNGVYHRLTIGGGKNLCRFSEKVKFSIERKREAMKKALSYKHKAYLTK